MFLFLECMMKMAMLFCLFCWKRALQQIVMANFIFFFLLSVVASGI